MINNNLNKTIKLFENVPTDKFKDMTNLEDFYYYENKLTWNLKGGKYDCPTSSSWFNRR